jgi:flagellar motor switch/type III secretory pathway protein FliN
MMSSLCRKVAQLHSPEFGAVKQNQAMTTQSQETQTEDERAASPAPSKQDPMQRFDWLPCRLSLEIPVSEFTLRELLRLHPGSVVRAAVRTSEEVPLRVNERLIAWIQFEMIGERLAARIMELA